MPSNLRYRRIPKHIKFPFGYTVHIKLRTTKELSDEWGEGTYGVWDVDVRTIYLDKLLPIARRRHILLHELVHAWADYQLYCTEVGLAKS